MRFGLSRATTLLYFISGGRFPIFELPGEKSNDTLAQLPHSS